MGENSPKEEIDFGEDEPPMKKTKLDDVVTAETVVKNHKCPHLNCEWTFQLENELVVHMSVHTKKNTVSCTWNGCGKFFKTNGSMIAHVSKSHVHGKIHECVWGGCQQKFKSKYQLVVHIQRHENKKTFHCMENNCKATFNTHAGLYGHGRVHSEDRPYKCEWNDCLQCFKTKTALTAHMAVHTGVKQFKCSWCDKCFSIKTNMEVHTRTHTGHRPYKCTYDGCLQAFTAKHSLYAHSFKHTGNKPYKCLQVGCGMSFVFPFSLDCHIRMHSGIRSYVCKEPGCDVSCVNSNGLRDHEMRRHKDQNSIEVKVWKSKKNAYRKNRYHTNSEFRARLLCSAAMTNWMKTKGGVKTSVIRKLVGCTWAHLVLHLNNNPWGYTVGQKGIDIDHIRPVSSFVLFNNPIEQRTCMNWNNLQLMPLNENRGVKGASYNEYEYNASPMGKAIALLRLKWEIEFAKDEDECEDEDQDQDQDQDEKDESEDDCGEDADEFEDMGGHDACQSVVGV